MSDADKFRAGIPTSTDPARLEREARRIEEKGMTMNPSARQVLLDLADRCEREEPSRELEVAIYTAAATIDEAHCSAWCRQNGRSDLTRERYMSTWAAYYTTSLDAAVTLVPGNATWQVTERGDAEVTVLAGRFLVSDDIERHGRNAKTPALALCAASLRARAEAL